jgi:hypothetical protein
LTLWRHQGIWVDFGVEACSWVKFSLLISVPLWNGENNSNVKRNTIKIKCCFHICCYPNRPKHPAPDCMFLMSESAVRVLLTRWTSRSILTHRNCDCSYDSSNRHIQLYLQVLKIVNCNWLNFNKLRHPKTELVKHSRE